MNKINILFKIFKYFNTFLFAIIFISGCINRNEKIANTKVENNISFKNVIQTLDQRYYVQSIVNIDSGRYVLFFKILNDSVFSVKFMYFENILYDKPLFLQTNRDSNFVCYYNINRNQFIGVYGNSQNLVKSNDFFSIKIDSADIFLTIKSRVFHNRNFYDEKFTRQKFPTDDNISIDGHLFYVHSGTRYFYRLKRKIVEDEKIQNLECYQGCSQLEKKILIPKKKFIESSEVITDVGNGPFYEILDGKIFKLMIIGFGESEDSKFGVTCYNDQIWIKADDFNKYFERF